MWFSGLPLADAGNRSDGYNTVPQYVEKVLGGGGTSPSQAQGAPDTAALMEAMANPWLSQEQKAMIGAMLGQTQQQADPLYQATLAEKQAQAAAGQADPTSGLPAGYRELLLRADAAGLGAGTTDYQQFMLNGGPDPSSFRTLEAQALAGGLVPGSAEFMTFMATRGAGPAAQAGAEGKAAGEARASANSLTAKLPGLNSVIDQLDALAEQATYTGVGRALNWAGKELGLPPGDASIAREQYIAMVNNQVLPLLVDTFGSQFTVVEGESLRKTLGDPNQPPAVKQVILRAFIEQKTRDAQALQDQADMGPGGQPPPSGAGPASRTWNPETGAFE